MVHWGLFRKSVGDSMLLWLACAVCLFLFGWLFVTINAGFDMASFEAIIDLLPEPIQRLSPIPLDQLTSFDSRLSVFFEDPLIYVIITSWCISRSSDTVSGQINAGTMEMLLAQPITRSQVVLTPTLVIFLGLVGLTVFACGGLWVGIQTATVESSNGVQSLIFPGTVAMVPATTTTPLREMVTLSLMLPAVSNLICFGLFIFGITTMISAFDRYRWRTIGVAISVVIVSFVFEILAQSTDRLKWLEVLTFFRAYEPVKFVTDSVSAGSTQWTWFLRDDAGHISDLGVLSCNLILAALGGLAMLIATRQFRSRDLPAPL
ncbi:MAG: ABC transporter permease subunit [Planctomycetota bacterium]